VKVTADTITDVQIAQLWREATTAPLPQADPDLAQDCDVARYDIQSLNADERRLAARARCADAWNARHGDKP
jgi:hypothetical protein